MTANDPTTDIPEPTALRPFVTLKELDPKPLPEKTDEQVRADMRESVRRNATALQTLANL